MADGIQSTDGGAAAGAGVPAQHRTFSFFVAPVFFGLAAWFLFGPDLGDLPKAATPPINRAQLVPSGLREVVIRTDPPQLHINGFDRTCMDCHRAFENPDPRIVELQQHKHIKLRHGINTHCYDCHDMKDRNRLVRRDGTTFPFTEVPELCAQCHTRIHADWKEGIHGKRLGHWDEAMGPREPIVCTGCHDPHWPSRPAMSGLRPFPGPHTIRMGEGDGHGEEEDIEIEDPLQRAIHGGKGH